MRNIFRDRDGYILVLGLIVMPIFVGFGLLIVDVGRGNNAQSDLSAAADSAALAAARELDGGFDAIPRAKAAMALLTNSVSMLSQDGEKSAIPLVYQDTSGNEFSVAFLDAIPASDDTLIDADWINAHITTSGPDAEYVYVRVQSVNLDTVFLNPVDLLRRSVPVAASAVAMSQSAACDVTPVYICNPFEFDSTGGYVGDLLQQRFRNGDLHGRIVRLHPKGNETHAPGNFGFLDVNEKGGAKAITNLIAGERNPSCYAEGKVTTKPGATSSIRAGFNVRFDIYEGTFNGYKPNQPNSFPISPALNVRKGYVPTVKGNGKGKNSIDDCNATLSDDYFGNADGVLDGVWGLADNFTMQPPNAGVAGAYIGIGDWPIDQYLTEVYGGGVAPAIKNAIPSSFPGNLPGGVGAAMPSRYDVYRYEIESGLYMTRTIGSGTAASPNGESGAAMCGQSKAQPIMPTTDPDRRLIFVAIIDCGTAANLGKVGGKTEYEVNSYASAFLVRPVEGNGTIDIEIVDITGWGGNGTLETFIREEAVLVR